MLATQSTMTANAAVSMEAINCSPYQTSAIPKFPFEITQQNQHPVFVRKALAHTLNSYLLNQIGHQTQRYEQQFEALLNGDNTYDSLVSSQKCAVKWADMLDQDGLTSGLSTYEKMTTQNNVTAEIACSAAHSLEMHRMALAEPLVERIRLAYLFVFSGNLSDAYEAINEAADLVVAEPALKIEHIADIVHGVQILRDLIKLAQEAHCVCLLFDECDSDRDGRITRENLVNAALRRSCEIPATVLAFLKQNFESICACQSDDQPAITMTNLDLFMRRSNWLYSAFKDLLT